jgi:hypothetical protein
MADGITLQALETGRKMNLWKVFLVCFRVGTTNLSRAPEFIPPCSILVLFSWFLPPIKLTAGCQHMIILTKSITL